MPFGFVTKGEDFRGGRRGLVRVESVNFFFFYKKFFYKKFFYKNAGLLVKERKVTFDRSCFSFTERN